MMLFTMAVNIISFVSKHKKRIFYGLVGLLGLIMLTPLLVYIAFASDLSDKDRIMNRSKTGLTLLDREGQAFFSFYQSKDIEYVPLTEIPKSTQQALIASEDKNFYTNPGFSIRGMIRAFIVNTQSGEILQGGSTITQGLVKNQLLSSERSFLRKIQEIILANEINRRFSKDDVLEMYLNSAYFGEGAFGIENAAESYFGIRASDLTLAQSALLIGLLPAPSTLSPISNDPESAFSRQKIVLNEMVEDGYITGIQADQALSEKIIFSPVKEDLNVFAPHFALYVKNELIKKYGEENVIRQGMTVRTTINRDWQVYAESTVQNRVSALAGRNASNGSAVAIDPKTGEILIMVGSANWNNENFGKVNMAISPRQPGSSFKPIIYAAALERLIITPASILRDRPTTFPGNYKPKNYDNRTRGPVTVRRALANSLNIPAVEVMQKTGIGDGLEMARRLGINSLSQNLSDHGLSLVLGTGEVSLVEMTGAYAVFANKGAYNKPTGIIEITDKYGKRIYKENPENRNALGEDVSFLISSILSDRNARAETFGSALNISRQAAVKTGTTEDYRDALTIGYTPNLAVGVWIGNNNNKPMDNIAGSLGAAPIWRDLAGYFLASLPNENFREPSNVIRRRVCPYIGTDTKSATSSAIMEYFISGTQPSFDCDRGKFTDELSPTAAQDISETPSPTSEPTASPTPEVSPTPDVKEKDNGRNRRPTLIPTLTPIQTSPASIPTHAQELLDAEFELD